MSEIWPELNYESWKHTYHTLHRWVQIVGKIRLCKEPWSNHSWSSTLYVTSRGLGTSAIPTSWGNFSIDFDFIQHKLVIQTSTGEEVALHLQNESVANFYERVSNTLKYLGISTNFDPRPNELPDATLFAEDLERRTYVPEDAKRFWDALVNINNVFKSFRSTYVGKASPVHFFWGSFDLAVTRFSGRRAPQHPGGIPHLSNRVVREAYSHEVSSCGFWPGNDDFPNAVFYSYAYPEPPMFAKATLQVPGAHYDPMLREFVLPYDAVRRSGNPSETLTSFLNGTYLAAANLGDWQRDLLEVSPYLQECQKTFL